MKEGFVNHIDDDDDDDDDEFYIREEEDDDVDFQRNAFDIIIDDEDRISFHYWKTNLLFIMHLF